MTENKMVSAKRFDEHLRKVACPQCRARLFDTNPDNWEYKAIVMRMGDRTSFDIAEKCPKCKALVGISLERKQAQVKFRTVSNQPPVDVRSLSLPMPRCSSGRRRRRVTEYREDHHPPVCEYGKQG